jgi:hypothetical protein
MSKKLYLLAVGVNEFLAEKVSDLNGCENDAKSVYAYLEESSKNTEFEFHGKMLLSKEATKSNVVEHFQNHLGQAAEGDIAVFYFSGHGASEKADPVFHPFSPRPLLGTMVCHDSRTGGVADFADKELRYLVHKVTTGKGKAVPPHFVIIMDSCHSGGGTRGELKPRLTGEAECRDWSQFIFADEISKEDVAKAVALKDVLPEGSHIQLASCEDKQLAYELNGSGIFTHMLLDMLKRSSGKITYTDLVNRARLQLKGKYPQKPAFYATDTALKNEYFLGGASENKGITGSVSYNASDAKWSISIGAVHGLSDSANEPTEIHLLDYDGNLVAKATVEQCSPSSAALSIAIEDTSKVSKKETYTGLAVGVHRPYVCFHFTGEQEGVDILNEFYSQDKNKHSLESRNIKIVENELSANYVVRGVDGQYFLTLPFDTRPLARQLFYRGKSTLLNLNSVYLSAISQWEYLSQLYNDRTRLEPKPPVEISVFKVIDEDDPSKDILLESEEGVVYIDNGDSIRLSVQNNTKNKSLYFTLFYLGMDFAVYKLSEEDARLEQGQTYWLQEREAIPFEFEDYVTQFNFKQAFFEFKLLCSTEVITNFYDEDIEALEHPVYPALDESMQDRPIERRKRPDQEDWATDTVRVVIKNPDYKPE